MLLEMSRDSREKCLERDSYNKEWERDIEEGIKYHILILTF